MTTLASPRPASKNDFAMIAEPFLQRDGLPFADVLDAAQIRETFAQEDALFAEENIFSTEVVLWAFLAQCLRDGKQAACEAAVKDIMIGLLQRKQTPPSGDTGDYCRARAKLNLRALQRLVTESARQLEDQAEASWLWEGRHAKLVDGFTFTMPDTPDNQAEFPQNPAQEPGLGFPIARGCAVLSLATGCVCDLAIGPYEGKETGECALLRDLLDGFDPGDVVVFDRYYCSYMMLALLVLHGVEVCARVHQRRSVDFRRGQGLGEYDHVVTWTRPARPPWMSRALYAQIPETLTLREVEYDVCEEGCRTESLVVVTTLTDAERYSKQAIAGLYRCRWNAELDIRSIKQTLGLDHLRCQSPHMIRRELWVTLLAYNLIRKVMAMAATVHGKQPRCLSFTSACQTVLSTWILWSTGVVIDPDRVETMMLKGLAANEVANRPGRFEPREIKRRRHHYPLMQRPRHELRAKRKKT